MHTVVETPAFLQSAREEGIGDDDRAAMVSYVAQHPGAGDLIPGTGGARKLRFAGRGRGKSGGYRVITFFGGDDIPVFLLDVFGKGSKADLSGTERNELKNVLTRLPDAWRAMVKTRVAQSRR
jgi:hypothetical protein